MNKTQNQQELPAPAETQSKKVIEKKEKEVRKLNKPGSPPGPGLSVTAFVDLMRKLEPLTGNFSNEQVRFIQLCVQRFERDQQGVVKTKLAIPKPKKQKLNRPAPTAGVADFHHSDKSSEAFLDRLTQMTTEDDVIRAIENLPDARAEQIAALHGLRNTSPAQARQKLMETVVTLRQMSRIQNAGKPTSKGS